MHGGDDGPQPVRHAAQASRPAQPGGRFVPSASSARPASTVPDEALPEGDDTTGAASRVPLMQELPGVRRIRFSSPQVVYAATHAGLLRSVDAGQTFEPLLLPGEPHLRDVRTLEDLARIPTLNKNHLRESEAALPPFGDYRGSSPESWVRIGQTTGSSGRPTLIVWTEHDLAVDYAASARARRRQWVSTRRS